MITLFLSVTYLACDLVKTRQIKTLPVQFSERICCEDVKIFDGVPTLDDFTDYGFKSEKTSWIHGGEGEALNKMEKFLAQKKRVIDFEKPKTNPTTMEPDTTALSPYLAVGSLR